MVDKMTEDYSKNSHNQRKNLESALPKVLEHTKQYLSDRKSYLEKKGFITIADLGCADGTNDILIYKNMIRLIEQEVPGISIVFYLNDLPSQNASQTIENVEKEMSKDTYNNLHFYSKPSSFYNALFPSNYIDIFMTFSSLHWLPGDSPPDYDTFEFRTNRRLQDDANYRDWFGRQEKALMDFCKFRFNELSENGLLIITAPMFYSDEEIFILNAKLHYKMRACLNQVLIENRMELMVDKVNLNGAFRDNKYFTEVLQQLHDSKEISNFKELTNEVMQFDQPLKLMLRDKMIDEKTFGEEFTKFVRAFSYNSQLKALIKNEVPDEVAKMALDLYYERVQEIVALESTDVHDVTNAMIAIYQKKQAL